MDPKALARIDSGFRRTGRAARIASQRRSLSLPHQESRDSFADHSAAAEESWLLHRLAESADGLAGREVRRGRRQHFPGVSRAPRCSTTKAIAVVGVRTGDKGIDKEGKRKANFEPGVDLLAKVTVLGEGPRGSLTKQLVQRLGLDEGREPQVYSIGVKELWELPDDRYPTGRVTHTLGFPSDAQTYGGGWIYGMQNRDSEHRLRNRPRLPGSAARSARRVSEFQNASVS